MLFMMALVLGTLWVVRVGQGKDASEVVGSVQWAMDKGKQYVWNSVGELLHR